MGVLGKPPELAFTQRVLRPRRPLIDSSGRVRRARLSGHLWKNNAPINGRQPLITLTVPYTDAAVSGIAGIIHLDGSPIDARILQRMTDAIAHRGQNGAGIWANGSAGLGHRIPALDRGIAIHLAVISIVALEQRVNESPHGVQAEVR